MERKEAIEILKKELEFTKYIDKRFGDFPEHAQALDLAISSLETDEAYQLECERTTKNDLGVDCISRDVVKNYIQAHIHEIITESGEDKNKHTNRVLRSMIYGVDCMPSVTPQEPILDKIRDQIKSHLRGVEITLEVLVENDPLRPKMEGAKDTLEECLEIIDKYKAEIDPQESEDKDERK